MDNAYGDSYWQDQGNTGVSGSANAYNDAGQSHDPDWARDPEPQPVHVKVDPPKSSKNATQNKDSVTVRKQRTCCGQSGERLKKYFGIWSCCLVLLFVGVLVMSYLTLLPGLIIFLIGLFGMMCSTWTFRKCHTAPDK